MDDFTFTDYTLDLETMGATTTAAIVAMGAAAFHRDQETFAIQRGATFYVNVDLQDCIRHGLSVNGNTVEWWMKQEESARMALYDPRPLPLKTAINNLAQWVTEIGGREINCWTHATFDAPIIGYACEAVGRNLNQITAYKKQRDIRTLVDLRGIYEVERKGTHHNALDDAIFQAEYIWGLLRREKVST